MLILGAHLSASKGYVHMLREAQSIGANTFQFFTRNPRGGAVKAQDPADVAAFLQGAQAADFGTVLAHAPYTMNLCSDKERTRTFAREVFADDLQRLEALPGTLYNFHPGSHVGQGTDNGIAYITRALNDLLTPEQHTTVLLETMAGKGSEVGGTFEELRRIIDGVQLQDKIGVCLDTCHVYDGGYDIVNDLNGVLAEFDRVIGLDRLHALHLNDSKNPFASHKDRHECLGKGNLGLETFRRIVNHPQLKDKPMILETPNELPGYAGEIKILREMEA
jgi:deoxyribonuclease-4